MNNLDKNYQALLQDILDNGVEKNTRNGKVLSVFGRTIRHNMSEGFPLLTTKKMAFKSMVVELLWFLKGKSDLRYLLEHNCYIWVGDAYERYKNEERFTSDATWKKPILLENGFYGCDIFSQDEFIEKIKTDDKFNEKWGDLGNIYGAQWRGWVSNEIERKIGFIKIDQIQNLIDELKTNPDSRRMLVNAWNVSDLDDMILPPCHYSFQVYTRELNEDERYNILNNKSTWDKRTINIGNSDPLEINNIPKRTISLMYNARSQDVPLGTPFNVASYALLLIIIGKMVNMFPDELISNMGDCHIYKNQIDGIKEQLTREPYPLPKLVISDDVNFTGTIDDFLNSCSISDFKIEDYKSHPTIKIPLSN